MAQPYQLESRRLSAKWTRGFAAHLSLVFVAVFGIGAAQAQLSERDPNACRSDPTDGPEMGVIEGGRFRMG